ncbi:MAG: hypothetical protein IT425_13550 [Pirellulales bacterium]|nr:hypothetical protein [Pirellulales bacterium]
MLGLPKRSRSHFLLPVIALVGFGLAIGLMAWHRTEIVAELADRIARGDKTEATEALRQLATMQEPPLAIVVAAAASDEHAVAESAQAAIDRILSRWQRRVDSHKPSARLATDLGELASLLASRREKFIAADLPWLAKTTNRILKLAASCPSGKAPLLALHCDELLATAGPAHDTSGLVSTELARSSPSSAIPYSADPSHAHPAQETEAWEDLQGHLEEAFSAYPNAPIPSSDLAAPPAIDDHSVTQPRLDGVRSPSLANPLRPTEPPMTGLDLPDGTLEYPTAANRPAWLQPVERIPNALPLPAPTAPTTTGPGVLSKSNRKGPQEIADRLRLWLAAKPADRVQLADQLTELGLPQLPEKLVRQYLSDDPQERGRVIDTALGTAELDARPWLRLLAHDADPELRLVAVSVMATSSDRKLIQEAWEAALHDEDPRVADLAKRLRDRDAQLRRK